MNVAFLDVRVTTFALNKADDIHYLFQDRSTDHTFANFSRSMTMDHDANKIEHSWPNCLFTYTNTSMLHGANLKF